mmetsp:Transcript_11511/g.32625  ORF Transcript_11511/g.32625 Transcript_11511/m.32625 type:complete len:262 (-) Transcript_11511:236-1021(-)
MPVIVAELPAGPPNVIRIPARSAGRCVLGMNSGVGDNPVSKSLEKLRPCQPLPAAGGVVHPVAEAAAAVAASDRWCRWSSRRIYPWRCDSSTPFKKRGRRAAPAPAPAPAAPADAAGAVVEAAAPADADGTVVEAAAAFVETAVAAAAWVRAAPAKSSSVWTRNLSVSARFPSASASNLTLSASNLALSALKAAFSALRAVARASVALGKRGVDKSGGMPHRPPGGVARGVAMPLIPPRSSMALSSSRLALASSEVSSTSG